MPKTSNLARVTCDTVGTGDAALGAAVPGFLTFVDSGLSGGDYVYYGIREGVNSEFGVGLYVGEGPGSPYLERTSVLKSTEVGGTDKITLAGAAEVFVTAGEQSLYMPSVHSVNATHVGGGLGSDVVIDAAAGYEVVLLLEGDVEIYLKDSVGAITTYGRSGASFLFSLKQDGTTGGHTPTFFSDETELEMTKLNTFPVWSSRPANGLDFVSITLSTLGRTNSGDEGVFMMGTHLLSTTYT